MQVSKDMTRFYVNFFEAFLVQVAQTAETPTFARAVMLANGPPPVQWRAIRASI